MLNWAQILSDSYGQDYGLLMGPVYKTVAMEGSKHADSLYWCQVSGFGCRGAEVLNPETRKLTPVYDPV